MASDQVMTSDDKGKKVPVPSSTARQYHCIVGDFFSRRDRDAWAANGGFVYQAELTLESWLDGIHLELERGEDIDVVGRS